MLVEIWYLNTVYYLTRVCLFVFNAKCMQPGFYELFEKGLIIEL